MEYALDYPTDRTGLDIRMGRMRRLIVLGSGLILLVFATEDYAQSRPDGPKANGSQKAKALLICTSACDGIPYALHQPVIGFWEMRSTIGRFSCCFGFSAAQEVHSWNTRASNTPFGHMVAFEGYSWSIEPPGDKVLRATSKSKASAEMAVKRRIDQWLKENTSKPRMEG